LLQEIIFREKNTAASLKHIQGNSTIKFAVNLFFASSKPADFGKVAIIADSKLFAKLGSYNLLNVSFFKAFVNKSLTVIQMFHY